MFLCAVAASANQIIYGVVVDTSSIAGTPGSLDFQFNPGPLVTQTALLQVLNFTSSGTLTGTPSVSGDVTSSPLPSPLDFDNGAGFNDYFQGFTFGTSLSFGLNVTGPALITPDGTATSGSTFAFSMFSDAAGMIPTLTNDAANGFAVTINVNLDGTTTVIDSSAQTTVTPLIGGTVPEPGSAAFLVVAITLTWLLAGLKQRERSRINSAAAPECRSTKPG